jgi:hypothetical protein
MTLSWKILLLATAAACTTGTQRPDSPPPAPARDPAVLIVIPGMPRLPVAGRDFTALVPDGDTLEPQPDQGGTKLYLWKHGGTDLAYLWSARGVDLAHVRGTGFVDNLARKHRMVYESETAMQWQKTFVQLAEDDTVAWHHRILGGIQKIGGAEVTTVVWAKCKPSVARCETFLSKISLTGTFIALPDPPRPTVVARKPAPLPPPTPTPRPTPAPSPRPPAPTLQPQRPATAQDSTERTLRTALGQVADAMRETGHRVVLQTCKSESGDAMVLLMNVKARRYYKICALASPLAGDVSGRVLIPGFDPIDMYTDSRILPAGEGVRAIVARHAWSSDHDGVTIDVSHSAPGTHTVCFLVLEEK